MRARRLANNNIAVVEKSHQHALMDDRMMGKLLPIIESSFTSVVADDFRTILSQEALSVERVVDATSDEDDSMRAVEADEEKDEDIGIDDDVSFSSDESGADDDDMSSSFDALTKKVMSIWHRHR